MKKISVLHFGLGNIGKAFLSQVDKRNSFIKRFYGVNLVFCGLFTSKTGIYNPEGIDIGKVRLPLGDLNFDIEKIIDTILSPFIIIDTTASDTIYPVLVLALQKGGYIVCSNKRPFTRSYKEFCSLFGQNSRNVFYETTVGAGLPVISTLKNLLRTGDEIHEINGCLSGTLGFIFSHLDRGMKFSTTVKLAMEKGFTEPDPRDDLSGMDVARKALILARTMGMDWEVSKINVENCVLPEMKNLSIDSFMKKISILDSIYEKRIKKALKRQRVLRYVAKITSSKISVGIEEVPISSDFANLTGPQNLISFSTKSYQDPLVVKGPGAGIEVTAGGVFSDILTILERELL